MSHKCCRALSENIVNVSKRESKTTYKNCCSVSTLTSDSKYCIHSNKMDGQHKTKRLKSRKERSLTRGGWKETSNAKQCHHHCHCQSRKDAAVLQNSCLNSCHWASKRNSPILSFIPATQEPSIITDNRLIGHHGLFNHKIKSINIERLLSKQSKLEQSEKVTEENKNTSNMSSVSLIQAQLSSDGLLNADPDDDDDVLIGEEAGTAANTHDVSKETEEKTLQGSADITPGQRPQQQLHPLFGSFKNISSSKHSLHREETTAVTDAKYFKSEKKQKCQLSSAGKEKVMALNRKQTRHKIVDLEEPQKNQDHQTLIDGLKSSPLQLSSSLTAESFDVQHRHQDPEFVSNTISAVAARLCGSLRLPSLKRSNLLAKSREVLLKSLQEKHGPHIQENLLEIQRCVGYENPTQTTPNQTMMEQDEILLADTSVQTGSRHFTWESSPQPQWSPQQMAEDLPSRVDTSVNFFVETFRPSLSRHFSIDFGLSGAATSDLFAPSPKIFQKEKGSAELWKDFKSKSEEPALFDSFQTSYMNHTRRKVREMTCKPQMDNIDIQSFFPFRDGHSAEPVQFPQEQDLVEPAGDLFAPLLPTHSHSHLTNSHFQSLAQLSARPTFRSHSTDMMLYPPSHMLERSLTPPRSFLQSPEHWSFPPMRLY